MFPLALLLHAAVLLTRCQEAGQSGGPFALPCVRGKKGQWQQWRQQQTQRSRHVSLLRLIAASCVMDCTA